jgi:anti-sigma factor RsiW
MDCDEVGRRLLPLALGNLPDAEADELQRHIAGCDPCRKSAATEKAFHQALKVTLPQVGRAESHLLSVAAGYRPPARRWTVNLIALAAGIVIPLLLLMSLLAWRVSFEDVLVLHHAQALQEGFSPAVVGDRDAIRDHLRNSLGESPILPDTLGLLGVRPIRAIGDTGQQLVVDAGSLRLSVFYFPVEALDRRPALAERLRRWDGDVQEIGEFAVAMRRGRLWTVLVAKTDLRVAAEWISRFQAD